MLERQNEDLPSLFARLTGELTQLFDAKLDLLKAELKKEANAYAVGAIFILAGVIIAMIGFALLNVAIAFLISMLFDARPAGIHLLIKTSLRHGRWSWRSARLRHCRTTTVVGWRPSSGAFA